MQQARPSEPEGFVRFRPEWVDSQAGTGRKVDPGRRILRIDFESVVPLTDASLTVSCPEEIPLRPLTQPSDADFRSVPAVSRTQAIQLSLEKLSAGDPMVLDFEFRPPPEGGGIASFTVEGVTASGRRVREAIGLAIGQPGMKGIKGEGVVVYPAVVITEDD